MVEPKVINEPDGAERVSAWPEYESILKDSARDRVCTFEHLMQFFTDTFTADLLGESSLSRRRSAYNADSSCYCQIRCCAGLNIRPSIRRYAISWHHNLRSKLTERDPYLDIRMTRCLLQIRHELEAKPAGKPDAPYDTKGVICEGLLGCEWGADRASSQICETLCWLS
jgi:hypothetical protein